MSATLLARELPSSSAGPRDVRHSGYSLIELLIAILIALFLIGGVIVVEQGVHRAYGDQSGIAKLQDEERFAMSVLTDAVSSAGYFPDPTTTSQVAALPSTGAPLNFQAGQSVYGPPSGASAPHDSIYVRYMTANGDGIGLCDGTTNNLGVNVTYTSNLYVSGNQLFCQVTPSTGAANPAVALVDGVTDMQVWYGVSTAGIDNNVDTYIPATNMTAAYWQNVSSVMVQLTFLNPLYGLPGQTNQHVTFRRVIGVMGRD
ncbi:MAG TPA: PilW family protein [Steroidobacteraceae bacterium]|nr:PilW family protein [Steroidobacteraceae bacterium]